MFVPFPFSSVLENPDGARRVDCPRHQADSTRAAVADAGHAWSGQCEGPGSGPTRSPHRHSPGVSRGNGPSTPDALFWRVPEVLAKRAGFPNVMGAWRGHSCGNLNFKPALCPFAMFSERPSCSSDPGHWPPVADDPSYRFKPTLGDVSGDLAPVTVHVAVAQAVTLLPLRTRPLCSRSASAESA